MERHVFDPDEVDWSAERPEKDRQWKLFRLGIRLSEMVRRYSYEGWSCPIAWSSLLHAPPGEYGVRWALQRVGDLLKDVLPEFMPVFDGDVECIRVVWEDWARESFGASRLAVKSLCSAYALEWCEKTDLGRQGNLLCSLVTEEILERNPPLSARNSTQWCKDVRDTPELIKGKLLEEDSQGILEFSEGAAADCAAQLLEIAFDIHEEKQGPLDSLRGKSNDRLQCAAETIQWCTLEHRGLSGEANRLDIVGIRLAEFASEVWRHLRSDLPEHYATLAGVGFYLEFLWAHALYLPPGPRVPGELGYDSSVGAAGGSIRQQAYEDLGKGYIKCTEFWSEAAEAELLPQLKMPDVGDNARWEQMGLRGKVGLRVQLSVPKLLDFLSPVPDFTTCEAPSAAYERPHQIYPGNTGVPAPHCLLVKFLPSAGVVVIQHHTGSALRGEWTFDEMSGEGKSLALRAIVLHKLLWQLRKDRKAGKSIKERGWVLYGDLDPNSPSKASGKLRRQLSWLREEVGERFGDNSKSSLLLIPDCRGPRGAVRLEGRVLLDDLPIVIQAPTSPPKTVW